MSGVDPGTPPPQQSSPPPPQSSNNGADPAQQLADVRAEAAARRVELRETAERLNTVSAELQQYRETEPQRLEAATAPLKMTQTKLTERAITAELKAAAVSEGLVDHDLLPLIDRSKVTYDPATDTFTGIAEAVAGFKASKPAYFQARAAIAPPPPPVRTGSGREPPSSGGENPIAPTSVKDMDKATYAQHMKAELRKLRAAG